jgi:hypothetical protein
MMMSVKQLLDDSQGKKQQLAYRIYVILIANKEFYKQKCFMLEDVAPGTRFIGD